MKLEEGVVVEVLRTDFCEAWLPAKVVSLDECCRVLVMFGYEEHQLERVHLEDLRPCPPPPREEMKWALGDIVEVFDSLCWRDGKIVKILNENTYLVRVFDSSGLEQLKEVPNSIIRIPLHWHKNQWSRKDSKHKHVKFEATCHDDDQQVGVNHLRPGANNGALLPTKLGKRKQKNPPITLLGLDVGETTAKRRKSTLTKKQQQHFQGKKLPKRVTEDDGMESSTGSCCSNYALESTHQDFCGGSSNDVSSYFLGNLEKAIPYDEQVESSNLHKLELQAYQATLQAFHASGTLSWEQETLLTDLRRSLNISNDEYLLYLRSLLSTQPH